MAFQYQWAPGTYVNAKASIVGMQLAKISKQKNGQLQPADVIAAAKSRRSPLHNLFEWDDAKAAVAFREDQARYMIRHLQVVEADGDQRQVRAFVSVIENTDAGEGQHVYVPLNRILSEPKLYKQALAAAAAELQAFERKYATFESLAKIGRAARRDIESLLAEIDQAEPVAVTPTGIEQRL